MVNTIIMTPEEYKLKNSKFTIFYGRHNTPFGDCLIGITGPEKAICFLWFIDENFNDCLEVLKKEWPGAGLVQVQSDTGTIIEKIFSDVENENITVLLRGTEFQIKVWKALMKTPRGEITTYSKIAEDIGTNGVRAAGTAMKSNRIAYIVPCHRVTSKAGVNKYRWGAERRDKILEFERQKENV